MHLTPEQIDRQPFRMTRRGYDIVEVRDFLREVATEMRERRDVRSRLVNAETADQERTDSKVADAERNAETILAEAQAEAERRIGSAETMLERADERSQKIREEARAEADALLEDAEERAQERSEVVLAEAQERLDVLLIEERELREKIDSQSAVEASMLVGAAAASSSGAPTPPTSTLADLMKSTLRQEVHPD